MTVPWKPEGYTTVTPYLVVRGAADAIAFYERAFGAKEIFRLTGPGGVIGHAELQVGDAKLMLADEFPDMGAVGPQTLGGAGVTFALYVEDADAAVARALEAGATGKRPVQDQFYGDRSGTVEDPFGHQWTLATHKEDLSPAELQARMERMFGGGGSQG